jgi:hypothetical protein
MLKDLLWKELRQLWSDPKPSSAAETPAYGQTQPWQARLTGADDHHTLQVGERAIRGAANPCSVLATARAASGM